MCVVQFAVYFYYNDRRLLEQNRISLCVFRANVIRDVEMRRVSFRAIRSLLPCRSTDNAGDNVRKFLS